MHVSYSRGEGYYLCDQTSRLLGAPVCNRASSKRVDAQIVELMLAVVNAGSLELASANDALYRQHLAEQEKLWQDKLQRFRFWLLPTICCATALSTATWVVTTLKKETRLNYNDIWSNV